jgi:hypothetical protein
LRIKSSRVPCTRSRGFPIIDYLQIVLSIVMVSEVFALFFLIVASDGHFRRRRYFGSCSPPNRLNFKVPQHCLRRVHARARQGHQASEPRGHRVGWSGPHATELRADAEASRGVERDSPPRSDREVGHLPGLVEGELDVPKHLARRLHELYFNPQIAEFAGRTTWSLSNAFTSAFKDLDPIPQFRATAKLASFIERAVAVAN